MSKFAPHVHEAITATVSTDLLKDKLNYFYLQTKKTGKNSPLAEYFDYLWDLKETAILEGKATIEIPVTWLSEIDPNALKH